MASFFQYNYFLLLDTVWLIQLITMVHHIQKRVTWSDGMTLAVHGILVCKDRTCFVSIKIFQNFSEFFENFLKIWKKKVRKEKHERDEDGKDWREKREKNEDEKLILTLGMVHEQHDAFPRRLEEEVEVEEAKEGSLASITSQSRLPWPISWWFFSFHPLLTGQGTEMKPGGRREGWQRISSCLV